MTASELRIGNLASVFGTNGLPDGWKEQAVNAENIKTCVSNPDWFKPIPLTADWLAKFRFKPYHKSKPHLVFRNTISFYLGGDSIMCEVQMGSHCEDSESLTHIKYVHQLQNLFFALTGEELTIKP